MSNLLEQASLVMIPSGYKEDVVYSVIPTSGAGDLTFTRASNGTRIDSDGNVEVVPWNLLQYSEDFTNGFWNKGITGSATFTVTANQTTAPNGTNTADLISITRSATSELSAVYTMVGQGIGTFKGSIWLKAKDSSNVGKTIDLWSWEGDTRGYTKVTLTADWVRYEQNTTVFTGTGAELFDFGLLPITYSTSTTLAVEFYAWGAQSNIGSTAKPYFPTTDRLNVPRLTYQNGGGGCPSLLLEKQSTNLAYPSEDFSGYSLASCTIGTNVIVSPDGTQNADSIIEDGTTNPHAFYNFGITTFVAGSYTTSIYLKKGGRDFGIIKIYDVVNNPTAYFDLNNGTIGTTLNATASIVSVGNGWYRCVITANVSSTLGGVAIYASPSNGTESYAGTNGLTAIYAWGLQLEASSYPTSYIPTTSTSATRVTDACYKTGISSLIGQTEGAFMIDVDLKSRGDFDYFLINNTVAYYIGIGFKVNTIEYEVVNNSILQSAIILNNSSTGRFKIAGAYKANDFVLYINGTQIGTNTSGSVPATNAVDLYYNPSNTIQYNQAILFPTRLTNSELAQLTGNQNYTINQAYESYGVASESPNCVQP